MKKVMITGGLGFLGINLCNHLLSKEYEVVLVDYKDFFGRTEYIDKNHIENCKVILTNLLEDNLLNILPNDVEYIIHLAALPHVDYSSYYAEKTICNNILVQKNILDYALHIHAKVLFTSSVEVYGGKEEKVYKETDQMKPMSYYGYSKQMGEELMSYYRFNHNLDYTIVRLTNLFGPLQLPDRVIPRNICRLLDNMEVDLTINFYRDFIYVEEACNIIRILLEKDYVGEVYNLSSGSANLIQDVINEILGCFMEGEVKEFDFSALNKARGRYLVIDNTKIKQYYVPEFSLKERIKDTVKWYEENKVWSSQFSKSFKKVRDNETFIIDTQKIGNDLKLTL